MPGIKPKSEARPSKPKGKGDPLVQIGAIDNTFQARVFELLIAFRNDIDKANPDSKHNVGKFLGELSAWQMLASVSTRRVDYFKERLQEEGIIEDPKELDEGDYTLTSSPSFDLTLKVTAPVERFSPDKLIELLSASKYKIPELFVRELLAKSKVPTTSQRIVKVVEK